MGNIWTKKIKWFKSGSSSVTWLYSYENRLGEPVECNIIKDHGDGTVDVINKNNVTVFNIKMDRLTKLSLVDDEEY